MSTVLNILDKLRSIYPGHQLQVASVGGSGTWVMDMAGPGFPEGLPPLGVSVVAVFKQVATPFGNVPIVKILEVSGQLFLRIPVHGWHFPIPNLRDTNGTFWLLYQLGVKKVIVDASVGGIKAKPWDVVVPDDVFINDAAKLEILELPRAIQRDPRVRMAQPFCPDLRACLIKAVKILPALQASIPHRPLGNLLESGTYYTMPLTVFETPAEIRDLQSRDMTVVGQSSGQEALAARLCGMHLAVINPVVNYAEGLKGSVWSGNQTMADLYVELSLTMGLVVTEALKLIVQAETSCQCLDYATNTDLTRFTKSLDYQN